MPWLDENTHVTLGPKAAVMTPEELQSHIEEFKENWRRMVAEREAATKALEGLPYAAVPLDQLASIYERFLRLTRLGSLPLDEWDAMPEAEVKVRRAIFAQSDFGAVFAGQWLPRELREATRLKSREPEPEGDDLDDFELPAAVSPSCEQTRGSVT